MLARAAFAFVTETVGEAFWITGNLKWTLRERVVGPFVFDERGFGEVEDDRSCMTTVGPCETCRTTASAARRRRRTKE